MPYAILRTAKLKTAGQIAGSLSHTHRTRATPNADPERLADNEHYGPTAPEEIRAAIMKRLPAKRRKDAVICMEYFIGASPEYFHPLQNGRRYFAEALDWLKAKHGAENVIAASIHRDETSPHLVAYVVPITGDGRLSAKEFLGGKAKLSAMQTDFAENVGAKYGLERGIEGSTATHTSIKQYYAALSRPDFKHGRLKPAAIQPRTLQKGLWKRIEETPEQVAERVTQAMHEHYAPVMQQATTARLERRRAKEMADTAKRTAERLREEQAKRETAEQELERYRALFTDGLTPEQCRELIDLVQFMREQNIPIEPKRSLQFGPGKHSGTNFGL